MTLTCYRTDTRSRSESRTLGCPAGQLGSVSQRRSVTDSRKVWSPQSGLPAESWRVSGYGSWSTTSNTCYTPPPPPPPPPPPTPTPTPTPTSPTPTNPKPITGDPGDGTPSNPSNRDKEEPEREEPEREEPEREESQKGIDVDGDGRGDYSNSEQAKKDGHKPEDMHVVDNCDGGCGTESGRVDPNENDDEGGDDDDSGGGGCFLTTAIVERRGEADDAPTLTALRDFRDGWMAAHPEGPALVAEYYETAPRIVETIPRDHPDWRWIGGQVDIAVAALGAGRPEAAFETYCGMVRRLRDRWLSDDRAVSRNSPAAPSRAA